MNDNLKNNNRNRKYRKWKSSTGNEGLSRALSWVLRHNAKDIGLDVDSAGYVKVTDILSCKKTNRFHGATLDQVQMVATQCPKQRFTLTTIDDELYIRANQGHSGKTAEILEDDKVLKRLSIEDLKALPQIVHGTYLDAWNSISQTGLSRMRRKHIHFTTQTFSKDATVISGMRASCQVYIFLDINKCCEAVECGTISFYKSDNGVILTTGIDGILSTIYFEKVINAATAESLL